MWFVAAMLIAGAAGGLTLLSSGNILRQENRDQKSAATHQATSPPAAVAPPSQLPDTATPVGPPVDLKYVPHGAAMLVTLHPRDWLSPDIAKYRLSECFGEGFVAWFNAVVRKHCLFDPHEIAEAKLCLYLSAPGEPCRVAGVVTLAVEKKHSELLKRFQGTRRDDFGLPAYRGTTTSYLMIDERTFAFCPTAMAEDWQETINRPATTKESLFRLLRSSDRRDLLTLVFEPSDIQLHSESLVSKRVLPLVHRLMDWFADDVETVFWGIRMDTSLRSRLILRPRTKFDQSRMESVTQNNLRETPGRLLATVRELAPRRLGVKRVLGRFPAMSLAVERGTSRWRQDGNNVWETTLPAVALPNLVLASRLVWEETQRPASTRVEPKPKASISPKTIAQKLATPIDCDFRRTPLHEAVAFIGSEVGVKFELARDDLKLIGVTQNMPQEFTAQQTPATAVLHRMLTGIGLVIVIHDAEQRVVVTTAAAAKQRGETPYPLDAETIAEPK